MPQKAAQPLTFQPLVKDKSVAYLDHRPVYVVGRLQDGRTLALGRQYGCLGFLTEDQVQEIREKCIEIETWPGYTGGARPHEVEVAAPLDAVWYATAETDL